MATEDLFIQRWTLNQTPSPEAHAFHGNKTEGLFHAVGGQIYFAAHSDQYGEELWQLDPASQQLALFADLLPGGSWVYDGMDDWIKDGAYTPAASSSPFLIRCKNPFDFFMFN